MKSFVRKTFKEAEGKAQHQRSSSTAPHQPQPPSAQDVLRYRYHHGVNLGSIFLLERWLHGSMFDQTATGDSELAAVTASIQVRGIDATREKWERHWASSVSDADLLWLVNVARCTTIRLPLGYFTLGFCKNTPFAAAAAVYTNAWSFVKTLVARCFERGIGVLLDLHAVPGGVNGESHSGTDSGKVRLDTGLAIDCIAFMAHQATTMPGTVGVQVCNEAKWEMSGLYKFYDTAIARIAQIDASLPIYISDGWNLEKAIRYSLEKTRKGTNPVIVDSHKYYTFADKDTSRTPQALIQQVNSELSELAMNSGSVFEKGAVAVFVGEYSCTLSGSTWSQVRGEDRVPLTKQFGLAQTQVWQQRSCGCAFWTLKMDWMPGGDWGFVEQVEHGNIPGPPALNMPAAEVTRQANLAADTREELMNNATKSHQSYWDAQLPDQKFEHWRFADGWAMGWADARDFFIARSTGTVPDSGSLAEESQPRGGDKIGLLDLWILKRMKELSIDESNTCRYGWEWEQGFRKGLADFYAAVGI